MEGDMYYSFTYPYPQYDGFRIKDDRLVLSWIGPINIKMQLVFQK
jgi:hypothetical protein